MQIFLAGATGALGRRLVPMLVEAGHQVVGTTRRAGKAADLAAAGAEPVVMDGLDADSVTRAVAAAHPDVVVHQLTSLANAGNPKKFDEEFAETNRLRTAGTDHLLAAARAAGAKRFIAQSFTGWPNERTGGPVKNESDPLDRHPTANSRQTLAAIAYLENTVRAASGIDGLVLRYGAFYGPGTGLTPGGAVFEMVRKRRLPVVGGGTGIWSLIHIDDAASATVRAVERGDPGIYNIVDDEPAPVSEWLPHLARTTGAKPPMRLPAWLVRPAVGEHGVSLMTQVRGSSNVKAKRELGWQPAYPSWREGFRSGLA
jgi:nucleoside-diphosphate-sugar epimerase